MKNYFRLFLIPLVALTTALSGPSAAASSATTTPIYAQQLVSDLMAANQDVLAIEIHAKPPGSETQVVVAGVGSTVGRKDTEFELRMTTKDVTSIATEKIADVPTVLVRVPLHDQAGKVIGLCVVTFRPMPGIDRAMLHVRALEIVNEVSHAIPDAAVLFRSNS
ncbi:MAG: hypothetical protein JWM32_1049 [Verrucomicrobia bacterium]|nr:hypothetical protein [Verrucomicrobiota bacterium]